MFAKLVARNPEPFYHSLGAESQAVLSDKEKGMNRVRKIYMKDEHGVVMRATCYRKTLYNPVVDFLKLLRLPVL